MEGTRGWPLAHFCVCQTINFQPSNTHTEYATKLHYRLTNSFQTAHKCSGTTARKNKNRYDQKARSLALTPGDIVLVRNVSIRGKQKLADKWEHFPYTVVRQPNKDIPVYGVKREGTKSRKTRMLHRNLLLLHVFMSIASNVPDSEVQNDSISETRSNNSVSSDKHSTCTIINLTWTKYDFLLTTQMINFRKG